MGPVTDLRTLRAAAEKLPDGRWIHLFPGQDSVGNVIVRQDRDAIAEYINCGGEYCIHDDYAAYVAAADPATILAMIDLLRDMDAWVGIEIGGLHNDKAYELHRRYKALAGKQ
jgi:hypothetical protein